MNLVTAPRPSLKFTAQDLARAYQAWGCNCGPAALAACLGLTLDEVRAHLGDFEAKGWMNPTMVATAISSAGCLRRDVPGWPEHGLVRIQWGGPWLKPGVPKAAAYQATHWVACKRDDTEVWVFDVNAGGWTTFDEWDAVTRPAIVQGIKRADGTWEPTHFWEVRRGA